MTEDQLIDAAEREMDLYRDEITRLRAAHEAEIAGLVDQRNRVSDTADRLRDELAALRHAVAGLASELAVEAEVTSPSAKSRAQSDAAARIRGLLGDREVIGSAGTEHLAALIAEGGRA